MVSEVDLVKFFIFIIFDLLKVKMGHRHNVKRYFWEHLKIKEDFSIKIIRRVYHKFSKLITFVT